MSRIDLLKKLNKAVSSEKVDTTSLGRELSALKKKLREMGKLKQKIGLESLQREVESIRSSFTDKVGELQASIDKKIALAITENDVVKKELLDKEIADLKSKLMVFEISSKNSLDLFANQILEAKSVEGRVSSSIKKLSDELKTYSTKEEAEKGFEEIQNSTDKLRIDLLNRIASRGGGSPNQQINVNSSVMSQKYADINFVSDTAITWSATDDSTNKRVNLRASLISGGSGGPVRSNSIISINTTGAITASTDYVYFPNVGITFTLPNAVGNTNLYTVKNMSASSVLVDSTQGIDDGPNALLTTNYQSLSFISNSSIWTVV